MTERNNTVVSIPQWSRFERQFTSEVDYPNPFQEVVLRVTFTSPSGRSQTLYGFWDGRRNWRVRFIPEEMGSWHFMTNCSDTTNGGLHGLSGTFTCSSPEGQTVFQQHGPLRLSENRRFLCHGDGTPFFWLADTCWNGPLRSTEVEWDHYVRERLRQKFNAVQWVTTQWLSSPEGDINGDVAFTGSERLAVNPTFFQRLDDKLETLNRAGLLGIPVMLWAAEWSNEEINARNPGRTLPEDQAILLARYMVARWSAHYVAWILPGDGDYGGSKAERWQRIGRAVFGEGPHAPVLLHPKGMHLPLEEFREETWLDINAYQSGHGDDEPTLAWIVAGPPAKTWSEEPVRPFINLEPPYENHLAYQSRQPFDAFKVRRAIYWSLLVSPTAGVTYGGHGVWGWDDGSSAPEAHPQTGTPLPWQEALRMPAAEQMAHLANLFNSIAWWRLQPAPGLIVHQPGEITPSRHIAASRSEAGDLALIYIPEDRQVELNLSGLQSNLAMQWVDPRTGKRSSVTAPATGGLCRLETPAPGDWLLLLSNSVS
jgi:hypothetical protein